MKFIVLNLFGSAVAISWMLLFAKIIAAQVADEKL